MAKAIFLSLSLCFLVLFNGCLARQQRQQDIRGEHGQRRYSECQLDRLDAREPDDRIKAEAGEIEAWNPDDQQFRCAGVAVSRVTIERNGLHLPQYSNAPRLVYIERGRGFQGTILSGCAETYQESQETQQEEGSRFQDQHQKIRHFREGHLIAVPAGAVNWWYNDGDSPLVAIVLHDVSNQHNQLDEYPRKFYLAGNPDDEFQQAEQGRRQLQRQRRGGSQQQGSNGNVFDGFDERFLAEALNIDTETARRLQSQADNRSSIVRVEGGLDVVRPPRSRGEREHEEREGQGRRERELERDNGLEETICTARLRENIGDPSRADIFNPEAGRISTANRHNLPVLSWLRLSAERGFLYNNALYAPHWNLNAHSVIYAIRGRARVQVVDNFGNNVFDGELRQGQLIIVPQNFASVKRASDEGFEWIAFKTNDNAIISPLAGRTSVLRALPVEVIANAYRISPEEARSLKFNREEITLLSPQKSAGRRAEA